MYSIYHMPMYPLPRDITMLYCLTVAHSYIRLGICVYCFLKLAVVHPSEEFEVSNVNRKSRTVTFHCIVQIVQPVKFIITCH